MASSKIHTKEMICCIILIVVGYLTTSSYSTAISASNRSSYSNSQSQSQSHSHSNNANFNGNDILRDGDGNQDIIGMTAAAAAAAASSLAEASTTLKSHKKQISGNDGGLNAMRPNGNDAYSTADDIANAATVNAFDENDMDADADVDDDANDFISIEIDDQLSLKDQMRVFTQQMTKRFRHELKAAVRKTTKDLFKADFQTQLEQLR